MLSIVSPTGATTTRRQILWLALWGIAMIALPLVGASQGATAAQPPAQEGRIYFWLEQRLASVQPDGKDFKWHSKRMVNSSGLPNVAHLGDLRVSPDGRRVAFCMGGVRVKNDVDKTDTEVKMRVLTLDKEEPIIDLGRYANDKVWSADGAKLACSFVEYDETEDRFHRSNWIIDVKTKKKTALKLPAGHLVMDWSADGNWFLTSAEINAKEAKVKPARQSTHVRSAGRPLRRKARRVG